MEDSSVYTHSSAHLAVLNRDHDALRKIILNLPHLAKAGEVKTEEESLAAEIKADEVCSVIDRRDVPGRETPLHLAVRLRDPVSTEILMSAGADWSLQNENGWSALQEAVCTREENIAKIIARHYQPLAWAKWCRRLPRIVATASRIRDFYMEITFHFESSVIPFISRIAPSDTYRIWKRGSNLRADMTLAGFDGFRIQRSDQTFLFLGGGFSSADGKVTLPPGALLVLAHKEKEVTNALEGAGNQPTESEVIHEVALMSHTNMYRPGIDVTQAELVPHLNWRRQDRTETVGNWKAKVYDMLNVMVSVKSRRVPGAITDEELFSAANGKEKIVNGDGVGGEYGDLLTDEERKQLDSAIKMSNNNNNDTGVSISEDDEHFQDAHDGVVPKEKKGWFGKSVKKSSKMGREKSSSDYRRISSEVSSRGEESVDVKRGKEKNGKKKMKKAAAGTTTTTNTTGAGGSEIKTESEYKKGLRPVLWLTPDFPLKIEELLPLLDILANKVKAIRRLRELLTTKLPQGTFPVKVAIPVVPTIRVLVTFTKFEEQEVVQQVEEFATPPTSPIQYEDAKTKQEPVEGSSTSTSWMSWVRGNNNNKGGGGGEDGGSFKEDVFVVDDDPFNIPSDYVWIDANEKKRRLKAKRAKNRRQQQNRKQQHQTSKNNNNAAEEVRHKGGEEDSEEHHHQHQHRV
ncbi:uncharacterized protein LOC124919915 [Impatiens glandulifera]|uniref:uncharacterized protein LOC124919915 n=1 Tax=Impatiens glandulifera TaxID=253017 RepID=UPI001FB0C3D2|nr:uncharacterized protein LOC124919915 [Impatiens glandulifera]